MADGFTPIFSPAGTGHRAGAVPDPGQSTPNDYVLRADATWGAQVAEGLQHGGTGLTILAGNPDATAHIIFGTAFGATPNILVSSADEQLMTSYSGVTLGGFVLHLTAATPVVADTPGSASWLAI